jgi:hypothetical protein
MQFVKRIANINDHKEIFLQGSYRNSTNIHGESDVDIVVKLNGVYTSNTVGLNAYEKAVFARDFRTASYGWQEFRRDVLQALRNYYGAGQVVEGNKCLKVLRQPGRLQADVVPAIEHRLYTSYLGEGVQRYIEGIAFWDRSWREIVNFPKQHIQNGFDKNDATGGTYKPTVRIIKDARSYLIDKQHISKALAPSYFVEFSSTTRRTTFLLTTPTTASIRC